MSKKTRRQIIRALDLTYDKVFLDLVRQINEQPFKRRLWLAWRVVLGRLERQI